jgi:hypothetical protein
MRTCSLGVLPQQTEEDFPPDNLLRCLFLFSRNEGEMLQAVQHSPSALTQKKLNKYIYGIYKGKSSQELKALLVISHENNW